MKLKGSRRLSYEEQKTRIGEFLTNFEDYDLPNLDPNYNRRKYMIRLVIMPPLSKPLPTKMMKP